MGVDHSKAFVRITFDGIIVFCLNKRAEPDRCEMGMVALQDHQRVLTITTIKPDGSEELFHDPFPLGDNDTVLIESIPPKDVSTDIPPAGVSTFTLDLPSNPFDRIADTGDPEDFRWILDLQGPLMHGNSAVMRRDYTCKPKISVRDGIFYTHSKSAHKYLRLPIKGGDVNTGTQPLGKMADKVGADILVHPTKGLVRVTIKDKPYDLKADGLLTRYRIDITNLCREASAMTTDFVYYYNVVSDVDDIKFDLYDLKLKGAAGEKQSMIELLAERHLPIPQGLETFGAGAPPQVCNPTFMGLINTLP